MDDTINLQEVADQIKQMKTIAAELMETGRNFPALYSNSRRILASIKMLGYKRPVGFHT